MTNEPVHAKRKRKTEMAGAGCVVQGLGLLAGLAGFFGLWPLFLVGAVFFVWGSLLSQKHVCGACGNRVEKTAQLCPTCRAILDR